MMILILAYLQTPRYLFMLFRTVNSKADYADLQNDIIESVDSICRDSVDTQHMPIQTNFSKSPKQLTYKPL